MTTDSGSPDTISRQDLPSRTRTKVLISLTPSSKRESSHKRHSKDYILEKIQFRKGKIETKEVKQFSKGGGIMYQ